MITVTQTSQSSPLAFSVVVREGRGETTHQVTMDEATFKRLSQGKASATVCVEAAFRFLLEREPKEAIMSRFDITVISRYFPEFERLFSNYLKG